MLLWKKNYGTVNKTMVLQNFDLQRKKKTEYITKNEDTLIYNEKKKLR